MANYWTSEKFCSTPARYVRDARGRYTHNYNVILSAEFAVSFDVGVEEFFFLPIAVFLSFHLSSDTPRAVIATDRPELVFERNIPLSRTVLRI